MEPRTNPAEQMPRPAAQQPEQWVMPTMGERAPVGAEQHEVMPPPPERFQPPQQVEAQPAPPIVAPTLPAPVVDDVVATAGMSDDDSPLVAGDEDVIEKEWVDKAKKIIAETKEDPHQREQQIKKLQVEYLRKRYGREIGETAE